MQNLSHDLGVFWDTLYRVASLQNESQKKQANTQKELAILGHHSQYSNIGMKRMGLRIGG